MLNRCTCKRHICVEAEQCMRRVGSCNERTKRHTRTHTHHHTTSSLHSSEGRWTIETYYLRPIMISREDSVARISGKSSWTSPNHYITWMQKLCQKYVPEKHSKMPTHDRWCYSNRWALFLYVPPTSYGYLLSNIRQLMEESRVIRFSNEALHSLYSRAIFRASS